MMQPVPQPILNILKESIAFAYLYNIEPDDSILDLDFNGYRLLDITTFNERYADHLYNILALQIPKIESAIYGTNCQYVLVATQIPSGNNQLDSIDDVEPNLIFGAFVNTVLYFRLFTSCNLQMGTFFISSKKRPYLPYRNIPHTDLIGFLPKISFSDYEYIQEKAHLTLEQTQDISNFITSFENKKLAPDSDLWLALSTFNRACNTSDIFYKTTTLVTTLECLLADDGKEGEISFKLRTRLVLLTQDASISNFIKNMYKLRSAIAHKGGLSKQSKKDFKHIDSLENLYQQIKQLEQLCQKTILFFMHKFMKLEKFNIAEIRHELDQEIFTKLAIK